MLNRSARLSLCAIIVYVIGGIAFAEEERIKVIIDADPAIGIKFKDVDDGLMLLAALNSPQLDILGITTIYGNASQEVSFRKAMELVALSGRTDVPIIRGAEESDAAGTKTDASRFIVQMAKRYPGEVVVLAVGPMTNVATAISSDPQTADRLKKIVSMGGNVSAANVATTQCWSDLNYGSDVEAAGFFLESVSDLTVISIQTSERFFISPTRYRRLTTETHYRDYLRRNTRFWYLIQRRMFVVWDLVALACVVHPEWFQTKDVSINYITTLSGEPKIQPENGSKPAFVVNIPDFHEDRERFWNWFFSLV